MKPPLTLNELIEALTALRTETGNIPVFAEGELHSFQGPITSVQWEPSHYIKGFGPVIESITLKIGEEK